MHMLRRSIVEGRENSKLVEISQHLKSKSIFFKDEPDKKESPEVIYQRNNKLQTESSDPSNEYSAEKSMPLLRRSIIDWPENSKLVEITRRHKSTSIFFKEEPDKSDSHEVTYQRKGSVSDSLEDDAKYNLDTAVQRQDKEMQVLKGNVSHEKKTGSLGGVDQCNSSDSYHLDADSRDDNQITLFSTIKRIIWNAVRSVWRMWAIFNDRTNLVSGIIR